MKMEQYLTSKEAKTVLKVQDCDLAHIRIAGNIKFIKKGNAFMYSEKSILEFKAKNTNVNNSKTHK